MLSRALLSMLPVSRPRLKGLVKRLPGIGRLAALPLGKRFAASPEELDALIAGVTGDSAEPDGAMLAGLSRLGYRDAGIRSLPSDPFSPEYARAQMDLYRRLSGRSSYAFENEATEFDFEGNRDEFFPYNTRSPDFVGDQLLKQGFLIKNMRLKPGARIVEFGAGWGNTTVQLAMMGYRVTVVEVNPASLKLIAHRVGAQGRKVELAPMDMVQFASETKERFDAALFVASFHHCLEHLHLLGRLGRILEDDGAIYFSDEPIVAAPNPGLPYPWGLRLDGQSLYYIRRLGWLELGFLESYFREALARNGWRLRRVPSDLDAVPDLYLATRK